MADTVSAVFAQTYSPLEIILSDQGSTDGTLEILQDMAAKYDGPNAVRVVQCPLTDFKGMIGLNTHLNWLHEQSDAEVFITTSADDIPHPDRTARVMEAFEAHNPSMVLTAMRFLSPGRVGITAHPEYGTPSRFVTGKEVLDLLIGGSSAQAWARDFMQTVGPLSGMCASDVYMPFLATLDRGAWFVNEHLHDYIEIADENNTGLGGVERAAKTDDERLAIEEQMHFQITATLFMAAQKIEELGWMHDEEARQALYEHVLGRSGSWVRSRHDMTVKRIQPRTFNV